MDLLPTMPKQIYPPLAHQVLRSWKWETGMSCNTPMQQGRARLSLQNRALSEWHLLAQIQWVSVTHSWAVLRWFFNVSVCADRFLSLSLLVFYTHGHPVDSNDTNSHQYPSTMDFLELEPPVRALTGTDVSLWQRLHPWPKGSPLTEHPKSRLVCCVLLGSSRKLQENCFGNGDGLPSHPHILHRAGQRVRKAQELLHSLVLLPAPSWLSKGHSHHFLGPGDWVLSFLPVCFPY